MADVMLTDDPALGHGTNDIRVFGKWSGADVQITDMSLEVCLSFILNQNFINFFLLGLYSWCKIAKISSTFSWPLSSKTFP